MLGFCQMKHKQKNHTIIQRRDRVDLAKIIEKDQEQTSEIFAFENVFLRYGLITYPGILNGDKIFAEMWTLRVTV